jgi:hypothetical protein
VSGDCCTPTPLSFDYPGLLPLEIFREHAPTRTRLPSYLFRPVFFGLANFPAREVSGRVELLLSLPAVGPGINSGATGGAMGMNRTKAAAAALIVAVGFAGPAAAGPFEDARAAYEKGDYATVPRLMRPLAEQGDAKAQYIFGLMYLNGQGVPRDYATALSWLRMAAEQRYADAQNFLGMMYVGGVVVPQDYVIAHMWFDLAVASGRQDAAKIRDTIAARMTPAQIAEAQKLAREWKPTPSP